MANLHYLFLYSQYFCSKTCNRRYITTVNVTYVLLHVTLNNCSYIYVFIQAY